MAITNHDEAQAAIANALAVLSTEKQQPGKAGENALTNAQLKAVTAAADLLARTPTPK